MLALYLHKISTNTSKTLRYWQKMVEKRTVSHFFEKNQDFNVARVMELLYLCRVIILNVWHTMLLT